MPTYEYLCEANGRVVEVQHKMADRIRTWGQLCERAGIAAGRTSPKSPVTKLISAGYISAGSAPEPACGTSGCGPSGCGGGMCGLQ